MERMKKFLSLALALVLVLGMVPTTAAAAGTDTTVYFQAAHWEQDDAWFAAYYFGSDNGWVKLTGPDANGYYKGTIPAGYDGLIFTRMNPAKSALSWDSKWNQTTDLSTPITNNVYFTVNAGEWDNAKGTWTANPKASTYTVAGTTALCGKDWNPAWAENDMELKDGLWTKTFQAVPSGTHKFKVAMNHSWNASWPKEDCVLTLSQTSDVRITFNRITGEVKATVLVPATALTLDRTDVALYKGQTAYLAAAVTPSHTTDTVIWTSSDPSVATVSSGVVTAVGGGTATITATAGEKSADCTVTVTELTSPVTLDVADGRIIIDPNGYQQGTAAKIPYTGSYIITGTTKDSCFVSIGAVAENATVTLKDLEIDCAGAPLLQTSVPVYATGTLKLISGSSLALSGSVKITGDADITLKSYSPAISGSPVNITCNSFQAESTNSVGISSGSVLINAVEDITILAGSGPALACPAKLIAGGDIQVESKNSNAATSNLEAIAGGDITLKTNSGSPAVNGFAVLEAAGDVIITNPGGIAVAGKLTVTDAASVTITGKETGTPALSGGADITTDGDVTISGAMCVDANTPNGYHIDAGGDISITGSNMGLATSGIVDLEAAGDITVTGKSNLGLSLGAKPASVKAGGDVTITGSKSPTISVNAAVSIQADGDITVTNDSHMALSVNGSVTMTSEGNVTLSGSGTAPAVAVPDLTVTAADTITVENVGTNYAMYGNKATLTAQDIVISAPKNTNSVLSGYTTQGYSFTNTFTTVHGATSVKVTLVPDGLTLTGSNVPAEGNGFKAVMTADAGCALPTTITVTVGGTVLTSGYTYDAATGELTIDAASITGDVVIDAIIPVAAVSLDKTVANLLTGDELTLKATVTPANATNQNVTWTSSNPAVATVENGVVTTKAAGTATITASAGDQSATCTVTVQDPVASVTIGGVTEIYGDLQKALNAVKDCKASDNAEVKLLTNVTINNSLTISSGVFKLDLGTFNATNSNAVALMISGGTVEVTGTTGKLSGTMGLSILNKNANVTISGGTVTTNPNSTSAAIMSSGNLTISGGTVSGSGRGIAATNGSLTISDGTVEGGEMGLYLTNCQVSITGGTITSDGAAISHSDSQYSSGKISISGGTISGGEKEFADACYGTLGRLPVLTGGTFPEGVVTGSNGDPFPVNDLLAPGYAYWQNGTMLEVSDEATSIQGKVEVKPICYHEDGGYTEDGASVHWDCDDCDYRATLTLNPPENLVYDGTEKTVTITTSDNTVQVLNLPEIAYEGDRVNVGTFTAKVTITESVEAKLDVTITPAVITVTGVSAANKTYDGKTDATVTSINVSGIIASDDVKVVGTGAFSDAEVGKDKTVNVTYSLSGADAGNYVLAKTTGTATASITKAADSSSPTTGDESNVLLWTMVMILSMAAMVVVSKKRLFVK